jgi:hypothetical protein
MRVSLGLAVSFVAVAAVVASAHARQESNETTECISNLKQVGLAYCMYMQDYDEMLPPMKSQPHLVKLLYPYCKNKDVFTCPATHTDYTPNAKIGVLPLRAFPAPASMPIEYDIKPHADGKYGVAYLDGRVKVLTQPVVLPPAPVVKHAARPKHKS